MNNTLRTLEIDGYAVVAGGLSPAEVAALLMAVDKLPAGEAVEARGARIVRELAGHPGIRRWPAAVFGPSCFAVRATLFNRTPEANGKVVWHQDLTISTRERLERPGFGPWSKKAGILQVQPPAAVLETMLTVRIHLDPCGLENGPVHVLPGSHRHGKLSPGVVSDWKKGVAPVATPCGAGGLLLMRPLLLHSDSPATTPGQRRIIQFEYAAGPLPGGLHWHESWGGAAIDAA